MTSSADWVAKSPSVAISLKPSDIRLLSLMAEGARQPLDRLAGSLKISKVAVHNKIKRLEDRGVITGYSCFIDFRLLGLEIYQIGIKTNMTLECQEGFLERIKQLGFVSNILRFGGGQWDFLVRIVTTPAEFDRHIDQLFDPSHERMDIIEPCGGSCLRRLDKELFNYYSAHSAISLKKSDLDLLFLLASDARQSLVELAQKLGSNPSTISQSIKRLKHQKVLLSFMTLFNPFVFGGQAYLLVITTKKREVLPGLSDCLASTSSTGTLINKQQPAMMSFHIVSNFSDLKEIEATVKKFSNKIQSHQFLKVEEQVSYSLFPRWAFEQLALGR